MGKPIITRYGAMFGFAKVGKWGNPGGMVTSQGCIMQSPNILTETDPRKIQWNLLPEGDEGLRAPKGPVSDETNLVELNDGSLYATYRTIHGHNCHAYSREPWYDPDAFVRAALNLPGPRTARRRRSPGVRHRRADDLTALRLALSGAEQEDLRALGADAAARPGTALEAWSPGERDLDIQARVRRGARAAGPTRRS